MPHGHGGGGGHGGGSHHSHRSRSHGGGSSTRSSPIVSRRYFNGARRFRYYGFGGRERIVYCDRMPKPTSIGEFVAELAYLLFLVAMGVFISILTATLFALPQKLSVKCSDYHIVDNIGTINNTERLEQTLRAFEDKTGICPCVVTVYDDEWQTSYSDIENAAYDEYVSRWRDEKHFLIYYSDSVNPTGASWEWHDMSGDDTDGIITDAHFKKFQKDLNNLLRSGSSLGDALNTAFTNSLDYMMDVTVDSGTIFFVIIAVLWNAITLGLLISIIHSFIVSRREYTEVPEYYKKETVQDFTNGYKPENTKFE